MEPGRVRTLDEELIIEEADAWFEYLEVTRYHAGSQRYFEIEPWAWEQLTLRLSTVERRRRELEQTVA